MPIATSDGYYYEDEGSFVAKEGVLIPTGKVSKDNNEIHPEAILTPEDTANMQFSAQSRLPRNAYQNPLEARTDVLPIFGSQEYRESVDLIDDTEPNKYEGKLDGVGLPGIDKEDFNDRFFGEPIPEKERKRYESVVRAVVAPQIESRAEIGRMLFKGEPVTTNELIELVTEAGLLGPLARGIGFLARKKTPPPLLKDKKTDTELRT